MQSVKEEAGRLVERLSDEATWDDLIHAIHLHQQVARGLVAAEEGRVGPHDEVKRRFTRELRLQWSEPAVASLQALHEFIAGDSRVYADVFVRRSIDAAESLRELPLRGRIVPELRRDGLRERLFQNYRIIYRLQGDATLAVAVVHAARDLRHLPRPPWEYG